MKTLAKSVARRMGYDIHQRPDPNAPVRLAAAAMEDAEHYTQFSPSHPLFTPWVGHPSFERLYQGIVEYTVVSRDRCYILASLIAHASHLPGELAECGVYKGGTALLMCRASAGSGKRVYLFDSFEGLPAGDPQKDEWLHEGQFAIDSVESVERLLSDFDDVTEIRQGWIPDTFDGLEDTRYAFNHIDVDMYRPALDCCEFFYPRIVTGGALVFDDYGFPDCRGDRDAVDEFFADRPESPIVLPTGQAMVLKLPEVTR